MRGPLSHEIGQSDTLICGQGEVLRGAPEGLGQRSRFVGQVHCGVTLESEVEESVKKVQNDSEG